MNNLFNPYKFSVYRNAAWTDSNAAYGLITFDTKVFDTGTNYDTSTGKFTAPIAGFYFFSAAVGSTISGGNLSQIALYKNGSIAQNGTELYAGVTTGQIRTVSGVIQLSANDYVQAYTYGTGGSGNVGANLTYFQGFLVSAT